MTATMENHVMSFKMVVEEKQGVKLRVCVPVPKEFTPYMQNEKDDFGKGLLPNVNVSHNFLTETCAFTPEV